MFLRWMSISCRTHRVDCPQRFQKIMIGCLELSIGLESHLRVVHKDLDWSVWVCHKVNVILLCLWYTRTHNVILNENHIHYVVYFLNLWLVELCEWFWFHVTIRFCLFNPYFSKCAPRNATKSTSVSKRWATLPTSTTVPVLSVYKSHSISSSDPNTPY